MKDKQASKTSINDMLNKYKNEDVVTKQEEIVTSNIKDEVYSEEQRNKIVNYNLNVQYLNPRYAKLKPIKDVIVRVFLHEPEVTEGGLIMPHKEVVPLPTSNGYGNWAEVESPFPYSRRGVVVAVPEEMKNIKAGDIVQLASNPVEAKVIGNSNNATVRVKNEFFLADSNLRHTPYDVSSEHFGYIIVPIYDIQVKV